MLFNKSILAATLAVFATGVFGQTIEIQYGTSKDNTHKQEVELDILTPLKYPGYYSYWYSPEPCRVIQQLHFLPGSDGFGLEKGEHEFIIPRYMAHVICYHDDEDDEEGNDE
ncbi:uncharacterized protein BO88DRAFT_450662 [Aspergillus vadensis CBS 113365]|uniref:Uncharacterized protein n=1 Tax=Aspergillus vadensis (strain CBS 113365 / IMI 142717 / IBT 24658) TaxID=1448311 RepID=A0A319BHC6_ASPVC|nr:hypothetical protein BO88DRAFT_450662 [Aspergillus vadensis CBS 113365]PYH72047.1 hypothetical protein BO88DRAFT_450662 [Aspergillus vadensis CBS 113365]